jgi:hypothetical protein
VRETISGEELDVAAVFAKRDEIIEHLSDQDRTASLRQAGVAVFHGFGRLRGQRAVRVAHTDNTEAVLEARHAFVVATGTRPNVPEIPGLAQTRPWTMNRPGFRAHRLWVCNRGLGCVPSVVRLLVLAGWDPPEAVHESAGVVPVHPLGSQRLHVGQAPQLAVPER